ncbi:MAG: hypothetical protein HYU66_22100, partial [Armatimonadetes bacterium]|nr:hypothetical protein [Armatimonadota bacterium]
QVKRPAESDETTAWDHLVSALGEDENLAEALDDLLRSDEVSLSWFGETKGAAGAETIRAQEDGLAMDRGAVTESDSIEGLLARLEDAPDDQNLTLSIENSLTVGEAIAAAGDINDTVVDLFEKLIGLYRACAG